MKGDDFPPDTKLVATPEPVSPLDVTAYWRSSAASLIDENFLPNGQPNPAFDVRSNMYNAEAAHSSTNNAQDSMTAELKKFVDYIGVTYAMHLIDAGLVIPVTMSSDPAAASTHVAAGSNEILRSQFLREFGQIKFSKPHETTLQYNAGTITAVSVANAQALKEARHDFKQLLMGMQGLVRVDGGAVEQSAFTRMFHMRALGRSSGNARHAAIASQLTSTSLLGSAPSISLLSRYAGSSGGTTEQYNRLQSSAFEMFMRKAGEVLDFQYMNCAGRAMSVTPEGSVLHGVG